MSAEDLNSQEEESMELFAPFEGEEQDLFIKFLEYGMCTQCKAEGQNSIAGYGPAKKLCEICADLPRTLSP